MTETTSAPLYLLRGLQLIGWRDMQHALDYLYADGEIRTGTLVAINAEKMLAVEDSPEVRALIEAAEFKYADGISVVRSLRKKYPQAQVSRVAGADLWEALMARAGVQGTPVFLIGGKPEVLAQTEQQLRQRWNVNIVGSQDGYFAADQRQALFERIRDSGAKIVTVAMGSPTKSASSPPNMRRAERFIHSMPPSPTVTMPTSTESSMARVRPACCSSSSRARWRSSTST